MGWRLNQAVKNAVTAITLMAIGLAGDSAAHSVAGISGAVNTPYEQNWVDPETQTKLARKEVSNNAGMSLKRTADLKQLYSRFDPKKETIVYCQSGARASETAGVLRA